MPKITLPDNTVLDYPHPVTLGEVAIKIGAGLAKAAVAGSVNGKQQDLDDVITQDSSVLLYTAKNPEGVAVIRHSCAHLFGHAIKQLFPNVQMAIGPVIENGFYYDIKYERSITLAEMAEVEQRMMVLAKQAYVVNKVMTKRCEAIEIFTTRHEPYKLELIRDLPNVTEFGLYHHQEYIDMCIGPHVPHMGHIKAFKLTSIAGAYWRGDANNTAMQRFYGTCWPDTKQLRQYLFQLEQAQLRDHRKLGKHLGLFHQQEEAPGMVFWHAKGQLLFCLIEQYLRKKFNDTGYQEIKTPLLIDKSLWEKSGHWEKFRDDMFVTDSEKRTFCVKPMNCPGHIQIFNQGLKSYKELPIRFAEFGVVHRNEASGTLHGLMRLRSFTQDDSHVFCKEEQLLDEVGQMIDIILNVYQDFGFDEVELKLSTRPAQRVGADEIWDKAEHALAAALNSKNLTWQELPGEGAFYGPKIEFSLRDCLHRVWQCGTIQVDFSMPARLGAVYIDSDNSKRVPVMIHRAVLGSIERFIGILIEHYAGKLPVWLAPVQCVILPISEHQHQYAESVQTQLRVLGVRSETDMRAEKINYKIRNHSMNKTPYLFIVGDAEQQKNSVRVREQNGTDLGELSLESAQKLFLAK